MHTDCHSSSTGGGGTLPHGYTLPLGIPYPLPRYILPPGYTLPPGISLPWYTTLPHPWVYPSGKDLVLGIPYLTERTWYQRYPTPRPIPPPPGQNDRHLGKHYLPATLLAVMQCHERNSVHPDTDLTSEYYRLGPLDNGNQSTSIAY